MRNKLLKLNTASSLVFQVMTLICGFVLPRLILQRFGSDVNGLVNSIAQFLQIISFLEFGIGAVVQSSLYKPLAENDVELSSKIMASAEKFFRRIALILSFYVVGLIAFYPFIVNTEFDWLYTALMILVISISSFAQYYFGVVDRLLLTADQRGYIQYNAQTITLIANTVACYLLIKLGAGIHMVKLTTSLIFLIRPLFLRWYVNKHYQIDRNITYDTEPIKQKWNGLAQHISAVLLDGTNNIILTLFSTLANVSIYSVYYLVVFGVKNLLLSMTNGVQALIGELWARQEIEQLNKTFKLFEWIMHTGTVLIFGCTGTLIVPFISVYTNGITDANYYQPLFATLLTMAHAGHCLRLPYNIAILAAGHYRQTQSNYIIAATINIVISISTVISFGLIGVTLGMLVAMVYQTLWMAYYVSENLIRIPLKNFVKQICVDIFTVIIAVLLTSNIKLGELTYISWLFMAIKVALIWVAVVGIINLAIYRDKIINFINDKRG